MNSCVRAHVFVCLLFCAGLASAQGTNNRTEPGPSTPPASSQARQREQWFRHGRMLPGHSPAALRYRAQRQKLQLRAFHAAAHAAAIEPPSHASLPALSGRRWVQLLWPPTRPGLGCRTMAQSRAASPPWLSIRPTAAATPCTSADAYGGVWKSTNAGALSPNPSSVTWTPLTDDQPTLAVGSIAIQPQLTSPDARRSVVLVGTGETNSSADSYYGLGILRSADAGDTWTLISQDSTGTRSFAGLGFSQIAFSTVNPSLVVAAAAGATQGVIEGLEDPVTPIADSTTPTTADCRGTMPP